MVGSKGMDMKKFNDPIENYLKYREPKTEFGKKFLYWMTVVFFFGWIGNVIWGVIKRFTS